MLGLWFTAISVWIHIRTSYQPDPGADARIEKIVIEPGGSAANCAAAAAALGIPTTFIGFTGNDDFGRIVKSDLERCGVSTVYLKRIDGDTGITTAIIHPDGELTMYSYRGVNASGELLEFDLKTLRGYKYLHLVIDTTGAGDAFCGGFLAGKIMGLELKEAEAIGNYTESRIIGCLGGHKKAPSMEELLEDLNKNHEDEFAQEIFNRLSR